MKISLPLAGLAISIILALVLSSGLIFQQWAQSHWQDNPDSVAIATAGQRADASTVLRWWAGPWIQETAFYRPLSSMLMWAEVKLWGFNFFPYTLVSWGMHALNTALLLLLLYSLLPGPSWQRVLSGVVGALLFNLGKHPSGPDWIEARVAWGVMIYWPVQTDLGALGGSLASLLCLDRYLLARQRGSTSPRLFVAALTLFLVGLLFKETALALLVLAPLVALYRNIPWLRTAVGYWAIGLGFMAIRTLVLPEASSPEWMGAYSFYKLLNWVHLLTAELLHAGEIWEYVAVVTLVPAAILLWRRGISIVYIVLACLVWPLVVGGLLTGNPAIATIPREITILLRMGAVYGGFALALLTAGSEPLLIFVIGLFVIGVAHINRIGPHYWYWPVALWGMADGAALNAAINVWRKWREKKAPAEQGEAT